MKKRLSILLAAIFVLSLLCGCSQGNPASNQATNHPQTSQAPQNSGGPQGNPPEPPDGNMPEGDPPEMPSGGMPDGNPPDGNMPQGKGNFPGDMPQGNWPGDMPQDNSGTNSGTETVQKADISGMDFTIAEKNRTVASPADGTPVDLSSLSSSTLTIDSGGVYTLSGSCKDITVLVDADNADVTLVLNGASIQNSKGPAIYVRSADKVILTLAAGTTNTLSDGSSYDIEDDGSTLDGAIFSKGDLAINGEGTLQVSGNYKHGIVSKDDLIIVSGTITVSAQNVGLNGKDCVKVGGGTVTITAGSDGIRSDNDEDLTRGFVSLTGGTISIAAGNDGIQAETVVHSENVSLDITAGGGSSGSLTTADESYKGIKATSDLYLLSGTYTISSKDDCIHSNGTISISGGVYTLSSGDDGIHADTDLEITGSDTDISVEKSYEGIEATNLYIKDGVISVIATDDGLNAAGGNNGNSGMMRPGRGMFSGSTGSMTISGGNIYIQMNGDGVDSNGTFSMTGGTVIVSGATMGDTSILDYETTGSITGGTFIGLGASSMAQNFSQDSTQGAILMTTDRQPAGTTVQLKDASGNVLLEHTADREFTCVILSVAGLQQGETYTLTAGSFTTDIELTSLIYGGGGGFGGWGGGGFGGRGGGFGGRR